MSLWALNEPFGSTRVENLKPVESLEAELLGRVGAKRRDNQ